MAVAQWLADSLIAVAQWLADSLIVVAQWLADSLIAGAQWLADSLIAVQASLPRGNIYINNCTLLKSMNCDQNV